MPASSIIGALPNRNYQPGARETSLFPVDDDIVRVRVEIDRSDWSGVAVGLPLLTCESFWSIDGAPLFSGGVLETTGGDIFLDTGPLTLLTIWETSIPAGSNRQVKVLITNTEAIKIGVDLFLMVAS